MIPLHQKAFAQAALTLAVGWALAVGGYQLAGHSRMTLEKLRAQVAAVDMARLSSDERNTAMDNLVSRLNQLSTDEQHLARIEQPWVRWLSSLPAHQRDDLIDATLPGDMQSLLPAFDFLPDELQTRALAESVKHLRTDLARLAANTNVISDDLVENLHQAGLENYFNNASSRERAKLAPLLEELHQMMESGELFRHQFRR
jgi:hypothetical protein